MHQLLSVASVASLLAFSTTACEASQMDAGKANSGQQSITIQQAADNKMRKPVINHQLPINKQFGSLDEYLSYLERTQGPVDGPWYKQVKPGVYELQTGNFRPSTPDESKRRFTREELEIEYGFSK